jgi:hypothetical protein
MGSLGAISFQQNVFQKHTTQNEEKTRETPHLQESDHSKSTCSQRLDLILESFLNVNTDSHTK